MDKFPEIAGQNLLGETLTIPSQLEGKVNLLIVAFQQWHVRLIATWVPFLEELILKHPEIQYYEIPTLRKFNFLSRKIIDSGMRGGIPSPAMRARTITLYLDKSAFDKALDIPTEETIYLFLVDCEGNILWRDKDSYSDEKGETLFNIVAKATSK
ncbi:MAG: hypothetical protein Q6361_02755 [Candidatus Hermodarchaeota archaeon]|nr:hypothetical protein [Candidatus Hermodarchaeota archaeon]